jgi:hypothetical protein
LPAKAEPWLSGSKAVCSALASRSTGKTLARSRSHCGAPDIGYQIPEMNESGRMSTLATTGAASALGISATAAMPSAANVAAPSSTASAIAGTASARTCTP